MQKKQRREKREDSLFFNYAVIKWLNRFYFRSNNRTNL